MISLSYEHISGFTAERSIICELQQVALSNLDSNELLPGVFYWMSNSAGRSVAVSLLLQIFFKRQDSE